MKRVVTVAGSDSSGGAGIQADLKTFCAFGVYGMSVITAVTAQNTLGVQGVVPLDSDFVAQQMDSVLSDIGTDALKTGMLADAGIVEAVAEKIKQYDVRKVVVDPVMVATGGERLLDKEAVESMKKWLFPRAFLVTPNFHEAEAVTGKKVDDEKSVEDACRRIYDLGVPYVLIKGWHLSGDPVDTLFDGWQFFKLPSPQIHPRSTHGTGCTFSSAIAAGLAQGSPVLNAVRDAKTFIDKASRQSLNLGAGYEPMNHCAGLIQKASRYDVIQNIKEALHILEGIPFGRLIPETQTNLAMAALYPENHEDVAAIPGRIIRWGDSFRILAEPAFGASRSMASMVLAAMRLDPSIRAAMNIQYSEENYKACLAAGFAMVEFTWPVPGDGKEYPKLADILSGYVSEKGKSPDIVFNRGGWGKEAHIEFFGNDAVDIANKIKKVLDHWNPSSGGAD